LSWACAENLHQGFREGHAKLETNGSRFKSEMTSGKQFNAPRSKPNDFVPFPKMRFNALHRLQSVSGCRQRSLKPVDAALRNGESVRRDPDCHIMFI
jgi:hypothetical protein